MEKLPPKQRRVKCSREELVQLDKNELVERIIQLEAHNTQLKNIINKSLTNETVSVSSKKGRPFDFSKCHFRRILLRIAYFGWDYKGLAVQEDSTQTIEHHLFLALTKSCLIEDREKSQYHRSGRTDKGVSAFGQVISITLRSKFSTEDQCKPQSIRSEMAYCKILNRILPKEIRAVTWMPIPSDLVDYSARFDCTRRKYKYYFPRSSLDITAMRQACSHLIGSHDFRNLCKMDVGNGVTEFIRRIFSADIVPVDPEDCDRASSMYSLSIEGNAFLWHQIRCVAGVSLLVAAGLETPDIIRELMDVHSCQRKPQYNMALDIPLNLFKCDYGLEDKQQWVYDEEELGCVITHLQNEWTMYNVKATMIKDCLQELERTYKEIRESETKNKSKKSERDEIMAHTECLLQGVKPKVYVPIMKRPTCSSLEERIEYYRKRRKIDVNTNQDLEQNKDGCDVIKTK